MSQVVSRALPERSHLSFYFPIPKKGGSGSYYVIRLPFYENINVKESKKARYQTYKLISRSSNLYSYLGADSRHLSLDFYITLPHLMDLHPEATQTTDIYNIVDSSKNLEAEKKKFTQPQKPIDGSKGMIANLGEYYSKDLARVTATQLYLQLDDLGALSPTDRVYLRGKYGIDTGTSILRDSVTQSINSKTGAIVQSAAKAVKTNSFVNFAVNATVNTAITTASTSQDISVSQNEFNENDRIKYKMIDLIVYWINVIRSSVVNNSKNPMYGPPILRLKHGVLYQDIPCICTDYSLDFQEEAGYDLDTLLPRRIRVSLKLEELRTGDYGTFDPQNASSAIKRDNLAGWEAVILGSTLSMDPGSGGL